MTQVNNRHSKSNGQGQGRRWIRDEKRLAIMIRNGLSCVWCGATVEDDIMTLDHLTPHSNGGNNDATNLATACRRYNSARGNRSVEEFAQRVASYLNHGIKAQAILEHIATTTARPIDVKATKAIIANRGSFNKAIRG